jgi:hypothetical protein
MVADTSPLYEACRGRKVVNLTDYVKADGTNVTHTIGVYEIDTTKGVLWGWDINENLHIRKFIIASINSFTVLDQDFIPSGFPVKIDGVEV